MKTGGVCFMFCRSGDDIGGDLVFDEGDAVAQNQFALFETLQAQQIDRRRLPQGVDGDVEIPMFLLQSGEFCLKFILGHVLEPGFWWGRAKVRRAGKTSVPCGVTQDISSTIRVKAAHWNHDDFILSLVAAY